MEYIKKEDILKENQVIIKNNLYYFNNCIQNALKRDDLVRVNKYTINMNLYISNLEMLGILEPYYNEEGNIDGTNK